MTEKEKLSKLHERLVSRRDAIFDAHRRTEEQRRALLEPEVEFEETSQKESLGDVMASFDEQEEREVEAINRALTRMELGEYRICESCGRKISMKRLEAIPWTTYCKSIERGGTSNGPGLSCRRAGGMA
jgi:RNA polymerase-binding transcription factor DksA